MSLRHASRHVASSNSCLRSSYAEISRFIRTRHHGITIKSGPCSQYKAAVCFATSAPHQDVIEPNEKLRKALDNYKKIVRSSPWDSTGVGSKLGPEINKAHIGKSITFFGYLRTRRDVNKKLSFAILQNPHQTYCIQLVSSSNQEGSQEAEAHNRIKSLREWTPVVIQGSIKERQAPPGGNYLGIQLANEREVLLQSIEPLNEIPTDIIIKDEAVYGPEQRHIALRTNLSLRKNIVMRNRVMQRARATLSSKGWREIETPILFKSTPEGAREFLVPTRNKGLAYALPQSPQQYKQILMASGFTKYFQFAKCFRDEDLRADRQPEFTQLDMELSFGGEKQVMEEMEALLSDLWYKMLDINIPTPLPRMTYQEAMTLYGSDKPDLRFTPTIHSITEKLPQDLISKITPLENPIVDAFKMKFTDNPKQNRKFISAFLDSPEGAPYLNNPDGQPAVFFGDASQPMGGLGPLGYQFAMEAPAEVSVDHGELLVLQARKNEAFQGQGSTMLGNLRVALHKAASAQGLRDPISKNFFRFLWVTDFPLFSPSNDTDPGQGGAAGLSSTHHPFTAPKTAEDVDLLLTDPSKAIAAHYDIVVNGVELGGGSRRVHNADVQEFIFRDVLKMKPERIEDFRHLLDVLRSGCPPHAGIALGWDRLMAVMQKTDTVRDVIAFPKSGSGEDPLVKSPNRPTEAQWDTYHLRAKD